MENISKVSLEKVKLIEFNLSTKIKNIFEENNIIYFSQLLKMSMSDLTNLNRMERKSINELIQFIQVFIFWDEKLYNLNKDFGVKVRDSYLKRFVETEKRRISQRDNFGIRQEWIFEIEKI